MLYLVDEIYQLKFWIYPKEQKSEFGALHGWVDLTCSLVLEIKSRYITNFEEHDDHISLRKFLFRIFRFRIYYEYNFSFDGEVT